MGFGKHQSFYLKENWITKGIKSVVNDNNELLRQEGFLSLGIGKNMQQSLRFWLLATDVVRKTDDSVQLTTFGEQLRIYDIGCRTNTAKNLLHYFLVTTRFEEKGSVAKSFVWFFNCFGDRVFRKDYLIQELQNSISKRDRIFNLLKNDISINTLKRDIDCLISSYVEKEKSNPEDRNISIFSDLGLIQKNEDGLYIKTPIKKSKISITALYYILLLQRDQNLNMSSIDSQLNEDNGLGKIFNLGRIDLIMLIEKMNEKGLNISITRTNNLDVITLPELTSDGFIRSEVMWRGNYEV